MDWKRDARMGRCTSGIKSSEQRGPVDPPTTDSWAATTTTNAPAARILHTAVWTGSEMIIWGGQDSSNFFNTGGRYNPSTDSWRSTSTINVPEGRTFHIAVWSNSEMLIWGGIGELCVINYGGRYNSSLDD